MARNSNFEFDVSPFSFHVKGTARYPRLNSPDTKFDALGRYKVDLIITAEQAQEILAELGEEVLTPALEEAKDHFPATGKNKKEIVDAGTTIEADLDEEGNENGDWVLRTSMKAGYIKDGETVTRKLPLVDAQLHPISAIVGSGSELNIAVLALPYAFTGDKGKVKIGVRLALQGVQVLRMVAPGTDASSMFSKTDGFTVEEEGEEAVEAGQGYDQ